MQQVFKKVFFSLCIFVLAITGMQPLSVMAVETPSTRVSVGADAALPLPDLTITNLTFHRNTMTASALVANQGNATVEKTQRYSVFFEFLDANGERVRTATLDTGVLSSYYNGLAPGRSVEFQFSHNTRLVGMNSVSAVDAARIATVHATVNASQVVAESNAHNNDATNTADGVAPLPDLVVTRATFSRTTRRIHVVVQNQGVESVAGDEWYAAKVELLDQSGAVVSTKTAHRPRRSVDMRPQQNDVFEFDDELLYPLVPPRVTEQVVGMRVVVDEANRIQELHEDNNGFVGEVSGQYPWPDLAISSVRFDKQHSRTTVSVMNSGTAPIKTSDRFGVTVTYLDATGAVLAHATGQWNHAYEVAPGRSTLLDRFMVEPSARVAAQVAQVTAVVDANNDIAESHEDNNVWPLPVAPPAPEPPTPTPPVEVPVVPDVPQVPDLTVSSVVFDQATGIPTVSVKNVGNAPAMSLPVGIGLQWLNVKGETVAASVINISEAVSPQETVSVRPRNVPDGAAILRVSADSVGNRVAETDETNNSWEGPVEKASLSDAQRAEIIRRIAARAVARVAVGMDDATAAQIAKAGDVSADAGEHTVSLDLVRRLTKENDVNKKQAPSVVPGNPLYFFKNTYRKVRALTTFDESKKAQRQMKDAAEKTLEAGVLAANGKDDAAAKQITEAQKDSAKAAETTKRLIVKDEQKGETVSKKRADQEQKQNEFLKVISRPGSIEKSVDESAKKSEDQARDIQTILKKNKDDADQKKKDAEKQKKGDDDRAVIPVRPVPACTADEWVCTWNACVWVGPGTEQGRQSLNECHKVSECATVNTPAPVQTGTTRDCAATPPPASEPPSVSVWDGSDVSGAVTKNQEVRYQTGVLSPGTYTFVLSGDGDADLYTRKGTAPTRTVYDCNPNVQTSNEQCVVTITTAMPVHVLVRGYAAVSRFHLVKTVQTAPQTQPTKPTGGSTTPATPTASCSADTWTCSGWGSCAWVGPGTEQGQKNRSCVKTVDCPSVDTAKPAETMDCSAKQTCTADTWSCSGWSACDDSGTQTELCTLVKDCPGVDTPRPHQSQACVPDNAVTEPAPSTGAITYPASTNAYVTTGGHISPQRIDIAPGGTITFQNVEFETHDINFSFGSRFTLSPGESKTITAPTSKQLYNIYTDGRTSPSGLIVVNQ